jgi:hypothetical protein
MFKGTCPSCGRPLAVNDELLGQTPHNFQDLAFRCDKCGVGFSNSTNPQQRRRIYRDPERNVPADARAGLLDALENAANIRNRPAKLFKFGSDRSEDAVTWTVFADLRLRGALEAVLPGSDRDPRTRKPPAVLMWGHAVAGPDAERLADDLMAVSVALGEKPTARSEPDVVLAWDHLLVFVEAKLHSPNDVQPDYRGFPRYVGEQHSELFRDPDEVPRSGYYELTRNWVIAADLAIATGRKMRLINVGPDRLLHSANRFQGTVQESDSRRFVFRSWSEVLSDAAPLSPWLLAYVDGTQLERSQLDR